MGSQTTTGKVKIGLALAPQAYELLQEMASGPRSLGTLLEELISAEANRRKDTQAEPLRQITLPDPQLHEHAEKQLRQQGERLRILHEIDRAILAAQSPQEIADAAAQGVLRIMDAARVNVALWQPQGDTLEVLATAGPLNPHVVAGTTMAIRPWPWLSAAREGQVAVEEDLAQAAELSPEAEYALAAGIRSQTVIPLMVGGRPIGHLALARRAPGRLPDEDLTLAQQIADSLAVAIHSARLLQSEQQARQRLETLQAANAAASQSLDLDVVLQGLLDRLSELIPYDSANVMLRTGETMVAVRATRGYEQWTDPALTHRITFDIEANPPIRAVFRQQKSVLVPDTTLSPGWQRPPGAEHVRSWLAVPLVVGGRVLGLFSVDKAQVGFFTLEHVRLAEALAPQAAVAIQNARLYSEVNTGREQLQTLSRRLVELQEEERRALSRDLHDTSGQSITALKLGLGSLKRIEDCSEAIQARVDELLHLADTVSEDLHRLAVNLRPSSLDRYGLLPALEQLLTELRKQTGLNVEFVVHGLEGARLPPDTETALYRIVQEATTNCARYAQAGCVSVLVRRAGETVEVIVEDDGVGFDVEEALRRGRLGLLGMRERADMLGGTLEIESSPGQGTTIYTTVPARAAEVQAGRPARAADPRSDPPALDLAGTQVELDSHLAEAAEQARARALDGALAEITVAATRYADAGAILRMVLARSTAAIGCENAHIAIRSGGRWSLRYAYRESLDHVRIADLDAAAFDWVERQRQVLVVDDTSARELSDPLRLEARHVKSYACVPLLAGDRLLGVLSFVNYSTAAVFHPSEVEFLHRLATLVALALENARLQEIETTTSPVLGAARPKAATERQRTAHEMPGQQAEYERLAAELDATLSAIADGLLVYDLEGRIVRMNAVAEEMLGYSLETRDATVEDRSAGVVLPRKADGSPFLPDEYPAVRALRGEVVRNQEMILRVPARQDGDLRVLVSSAPIRARDGAVTGCITTFTGIEAYHEANARLSVALAGVAQREAALAQTANRLRQANAELEAILSALPDGLIVYDPAGRITHMNDLAQDMLGYRQDTWQLPVGARAGIAVQVFHPDGSPIEREQYAALRALRGETVRNQDQYIHLPESPAKDFWALLSAGPIRGQEGQLAGAVVTMTDTTQLHAVTDQLSRREAALTQTAASLQEAHAQLQVQADELREAAERLEQRVQARTTELVQREAELAQANVVLHEQADLLDLTHDAIFVHDLHDATIRYWNRGAAERYGWTAAEAIGRRSHTLTRAVFPEPLEAIYSQLLQHGRWEGELVHSRRDGTPITVASRWALKRDKDGRPQAVLETNNDVTQHKQSEARLAAAFRALHESREQLRALSRRLVEVQERERRYVADQLYNEAGQVLAALKMHLSRLGDAEAVKPFLAETQFLLDRVMADLHDLATHLRPVSLDRLGLVSALEQYAREWGREHGLEVRFESIGTDGTRLDSDVETAAYRVVQEALMNVAQHAGARVVGIIVSNLDGRLAVMIEDDGVGFEPVTVSAQGALGLLSMRERVESVEGQLTVESKLGKGTCVIVEVPLTAPHR